MTPGTFEHFVFVDYENVPNVDLGVVADLPVHVTVLLGRNQKNIPADLAEDMLQLGSARVSLVRVEATGHNALDIILAFYLGKSAARSPGAQFHIVSKDKDFEPLLGHLFATKLKATRHDSFAALPFLHRPRKPVVAPKAIVAKPPENRAIGAIGFLKNPNRTNRPSTEKALQAVLKTRLGKQYTEARAQEIVRGLIEEKALAIDSAGNVKDAR